MLSIKIDANDVTNLYGKCYFQSNASWYAIFNNAISEQHLVNSN